MDKETLIKLVINPIEAKGGKAYFVGGCVRDEFLHKEPHDYDIVSNFTPEQLHIVFSKFSNESTNAEKFGVTMPIVNGEKIEIATFRKDLTSGRHPCISLNATIEEDAARRDFTINALYEDKDGNILDPTGLGLSDLHTRTLRFVGNPMDRLREDPLRAYRFVRFLARGFSYPYTIEELMKFGNSVDFSEVSKERKLKEIKGIFSSKFFLPLSPSYSAAVCLKVFRDIGLCDIFASMAAIEQSFRWHAEGCVVSDKYGALFKGEEVKDFSDMKPKRHGNVLDHTLNVWREMNKIIFHDAAIEETKVDFEDEEKRFLLILSAILHDIGKTKPIGTKKAIFQWGTRKFEETVPKVSNHDMLGKPLAEEFCKNLAMSNDEIKFVVTLVGQHMLAHEFAKSKHKFKILKFVHQPLFKEIMLIAQADSRGSISTIPNEQKSPEVNLADPVVRECINTPMPKPILTGDDLIKGGLKPGPLFSKMLGVAYARQYEANETDKQRLFNFVKNIKE